MPSPIYNRVYDNDYFSGTQAGLYIGDVFIDEITSLSFNVGQAKTPIHGYASQLYNAVSKGIVSVNGAFTINYKEAQYLYLVLMRYWAFQREVKAKLLEISGGNQILINKFFNSIGLEENDKNGLVPVPFSVTEGRISRLNIEGAIKNTLTQDERFEFAQTLSGHASTYGMDTSFEDIAEVLEDKVWGVESDDIDNMVRRTDDNFFDGFDMYVTFGDYNNPEANHTVERISGVCLTGRGKTVTVSGEPIQEEYQFLARNVF